MSQISNLKKALIFLIVIAAVCAVFMCVAVSNNQSGSVMAADAFANLFVNNRGFWLLMAATIGIPLYACGGGTIPLLRQWIVSGMSMRRL